MIKSSASLSSCCTQRFTVAWLVENQFNFRWLVGSGGAAKYGDGQLLSEVGVGAYGPLSKLAGGQRATLHPYRMGSSSTKNDEMYLVVEINSTYLKLIINETH